MNPRPLYVETLVRAPLDVLWVHTQDPALHQRWDLRFSEIVATSAPGARPQEFRYATRVLPFMTVSGTGTPAGERHRPDGGCTSALRFASPHPLSLIESGSGYWRYEPTASDTGGVRFLTGYDYRPRWGLIGRLLDRHLFRPLMGWATAWSFDRLRLWVERGIPPERSRHRAVAEVAVRGALTVAAAVAHPALGALVAAVVVLLPPLPTTPAARRCRRTPRAAVRPPRISATLEETR